MGFQAPSGREGRILAIWNDANKTSMTNFVSKSKIFVFESHSGQGTRPQPTGECSPSKVLLEPFKLLQTKSGVTAHMNKHPDSMLVIEQERFKACDSNEIARDICKSMSTTLKSKIIMSYDIYHSVSLGFPGILLAVPRAQPLLPRIIR